MGNQKQMTNPRAVRMCTVAGIKNASDQMSSLEEVRRMLVQLIDDTKTTKSRAKLAEHVLFGLKITKIVCDTAVNILANFTGPVGKVIAVGYGGASTLAGEASTAVAGGHVNKGKVVAGIVKTGAAMAGKKGLGHIKLLHGKAYKASEELMEAGDLQGIKVETIAGIMEGDEHDTVKGFSDFTFKVAGMSTDYLKKETASKVVGTVGSLVSAGTEFHKFYEENKKDTKEAADTQDALEGSIRTLMRQLENINAKIQSLQAQIDECSAESAEYRLP